MAAEAYQPDTTYWGELHRLDRRLFWRGSLSLALRFQPIPTFKSETRWWNNSRKPAYWEGFKVLGLVGIGSSLAIAEPGKELFDEEGSRMQVKVFNYHTGIAARSPSLDVHTVFKFVAYDESEEEDRASSRAIKDAKAEERMHGLSVPTKDDYEELLAGLQEGISLLAEGEAGW